MDSSPEELKPYVGAYERRQKEKDAEAWRNGIYTESAVMTAVSSVLFGSKSKAKYIEKPLLESVEKEVNVDELSEYELAKLHEKELEKLDLLARTAFGIKDKKDGG